MEIVESEDFLNRLEQMLANASRGSAHTVFLTGEAGVGKTYLLQHFLERTSDRAVSFTGACDSLYSPRPLGPVFDIVYQLDDSFLETVSNIDDRTVLFASILKRISRSSLPVILIFEDIHWADEATLDFIKFLARRIKLLKCLFILTYRDENSFLNRLATSIASELSPETFTKLRLPMLSYESVNKLAIARGYPSGEKIFSLTGGNPFYVTEILSSYSPGIPEKIADSILALFHWQTDDLREIWELLSISPAKIDLNLIKYLNKNYPDRIETCIKHGIIVSKNDHICFKHELFRITIEESLSVVRRQALHKRILDIMLAHREEFPNLSQLVHHAMFARNDSVVAELAPLAAEQAAKLGSHLEASRLYQIVTERAVEGDVLADMLEKYAFELYLISKVDLAIESQTKALQYWRSAKVVLREGNALRFLSRLHWFQGNHEDAFNLATEAIRVLDNGFPTKERALAYSNLSQLNMLSDNSIEGLAWGRKAIDLARNMHDREVEAHALINVGVIEMKKAETEVVGESKLFESLSISLANGYDDHSARAYANLITCYVLLKKYSKAFELLPEALKYCEERYLHSWTDFLNMWTARMQLELGDFNEAERLATLLVNSGNAVIRTGALVIAARRRIRIGTPEGVPELITEAKQLALKTREVQRIVPVLVAELEFFWLYGVPYNEKDLLETIDLFPDKDSSWHYSELAYWMKKANISALAPYAVYTEPYGLDLVGKWKAAAEAWHQLGCPYEESLALIQGSEEDQKRAVALLDELGARRAYEKIRSKLKSLGMKNIPRGPRASTRSNPANLTERQINVLELLALGLTNSQIADKLFISSKTVDHHISAILLKLDVSSRARAVIEARRLGILS